MPNYRIPVLISVLVSMLMIACSGKVKSTATEKSIVQKNYKFNSVLVSLSNDVKKKLSRNKSFNLAKMQSAAEEIFIARRLIVKSSPLYAEFNITDIKVRNVAKAVVLGPLAGKDYIRGVVSIKDSRGRVLETFEVNTSYSMGGIAAGINPVRMTWQYKKFAILAANTFTGTPDYHGQIQE